jgi:hypothetical protein
MYRTFEIRHKIFHKYSNKKNMITTMLIVVVRPIIIVIYLSLNLT